MSYKLLIEAWAVRVADVATATAASAPDMSKGTEEIRYRHCMLANRVPKFR
jgi:hypothetical protein